MSHIQTAFLILALLISHLVCGQEANAQSSLFNIPTTDVLRAEDLYLEADFDSHFARYENGGYQSYGVMGVYGLRKNIEVGVNAYFTRDASGVAAELQPNAKWQFYSNEDNGIAAAAGTILYIPLNKRAGTDTFGSVYATVSKQFDGKHGPRFTGGGYTLIGRDSGTGSQQGALLAYEQPIVNRVTFIADWNTGKNRFGYAATGVGITLSKRSYLYTAYYFGNEGRGNNSFGIYYGYTF
jgi:hypothetical protein